MKINVQDMTEVKMKKWEWVVVVITLSVEEVSNIHSILMVAFLAGDFLVAVFSSIFDFAEALAFLT